MLTTFKDMSAVDFDALTELTDYYIATGAKGLFANCLSSEMYDLSPEESVAVTRHVVRVADNRVPVVATGTFNNKVEDSIEFIKRIHDTGVESIILTTSILAGLSDSDTVLEEKFNQILESTDQITYGFYECPEPYKRLISPPLLTRLLASGRVTYFKDTSLDLAQVAAKVEAGRNLNFGLYDAYIVHAVESLKVGAAGLSCIQGNYFPELIVWLCENYNNQQLTNEVLRVQNFFTKHMEIMHRYYPTSAKRILRKRGLRINEFSRRHSPEPGNEDAIKMKNLFEDYTAIQEELRISSVLKPNNP